MDPLYFMDGIYRNVGKKIKLFGKLTLLVGPVASITYAIINFVRAGDRFTDTVTMIGKGFNNLIGGIGISVLLSFVLFAVGALAEAHVKEPARRPRRPVYDDRQGGYGQSRPNGSGSAFCMNCGAQLPAGTSFCNNCGSPVR